MNFNNYYWHDAIIKNLIIDRRSPGINDSILIEIIWPNGKENILSFTKVYWANLDLNFGIASEENILNAYSTNEDKVLTDLFLKWKGLIDNIVLNYYVIRLNSTGGEIKIISTGFKMLDTK